MLGRLRAGVLDLSEVHRFPNQPHRAGGALRWNADRLWRDLRHALDITSSPSLDAVGVDAWGVDYALLGDDGALLEDPYHYRDSRTAGEMERLFSVVSRDRIYATTGIQCLPINTLYQLHAPAARRGARARARTPDDSRFQLAVDHVIAANTPSPRRRCVDAKRGRHRCSTKCIRRDCRADRRRRNCHRIGRRRRIFAHGHAGGGHRVTIRLPPWRGPRGRHRVSELSHLVARHRAGGADYAGRAVISLSKARCGTILLSETLWPGRSRRAGVPAGGQALG